MINKREEVEFVLLPTETIGDLKKELHNLGCISMNETYELFHNSAILGSSFDGKTLKEVGI